MLGCILIKVSRWEKRRPSWELAHTAFPILANMGGLLMSSSLEHPYKHQAQALTIVYLCPRSRISPQWEHELPRVTSMPKSCYQRLFSSSSFLQEKLFISLKPTEQTADSSPERSEDCLQTDPNARDTFAVWLPKIATVSCASLWKCRKWQLVY